MPHIDLPEGVPGIRSLFEYRPETGLPLLALVEQLLRGPNTLTPGERELIASVVSNRNACTFCDATHSAFAAVQLDDDWDLVEAVKADPATAPITPKLRALLRIAEQTAEGGRSVTAEAVDEARSAGASDTEIHDTVLIASAFCMFNRYVDGLATWCPSPDARDYEPRARALVAEGYLAPVAYQRYLASQVPADPDPA